MPLAVAVASATPVEASPAVFDANAVEADAVNAVDDVDAKAADAFVVQGGVVEGVVSDVGAGSAHVDLLVAPPCLSTFRASGRAAGLAQKLVGETGSAVGRAVGPAGLFRDGRVIVPDPENPMPLDDMAALLAAVGSDDVVVSAVDVKHALQSPEELSFVMPGAPSHFLEDLITLGAGRGQSPDLRLVNATTTRLTRRSTLESVLVVDIPSARTTTAAAMEPTSSSTATNAATTPFVVDGDVFAYDPVFVTFERVDGGQGQALLVSSMLTMGGPARLKVALDNARRGAPDALVIMPGGVAGYAPAHPNLCADAVAAVAPDVVVPGPMDLALGAEGLLAWATRAKVPLLAANLRLTPTTKTAKTPTSSSTTTTTTTTTPPAPLSTLTTSAATTPLVKVLSREVVSGSTTLRAAIIGVVDPELLSGLPAQARAGLSIDDPRSAVNDLVEDLLEGPRPPDFIAVVSSTRTLADRLGVLPYVDVVVAGAEGRTDALDIVTSAALMGAREAVREPAPSLVLLGSTIAIRQVRAEFKDTHLRRVLDAAPPVTGLSPQDHAFARPFRVALHEDLRKDAPMILPTLDLLLDKNPAAATLARGNDIAYRGGLVSVRASHPPIWSDALFHRLAANALAQATNADVVVTATTPRRSDLGNTAVARRYVRDWLAGKGNIRVVSMPGAVVKKLQAAVSTQNSTMPPALWTYVSGLSLSAPVVGGRPIDDKVNYRVVIDDKSASRRDILPLLQGLPSTNTFRRDGDAYVTDDAGVAVSADDVVLGVIGEDAGSAGVARLAGLLDDRASVVRPEWRLNISALELRGTGSQNSDNIGALAATKETRASQPAFLQLGAKAQVGVVYDSSVWSWDNGLRLQYDSILLDVEGAPRVPQDQVDDVVVSTEARLNSLNISSDKGAFRIVPFANVALDSELTPTPDPSDPENLSLPRQALARQTVGVAAYPGSALKEVRLGLLVQEDAGDAFAGRGDVRADLGVAFESHAAVPVWALTFSSDIDARAFVPDGDDRDSDLALRAQLVHKLSMPVTPQTSVFFFFDVMLLMGKVPATDELAYNGILGGGVTFSDVLRW